MIIQELRKFVVASEWLHKNAASGPRFCPFGLCILPDVDSTLDIPKDGLWSDVICPRRLCRGSGTCFDSVINQYGQIS